MAQPLLHDKSPVVDKRKIGISYSGGGPLLLVELGIAQAFVELGVIPDAIAGVSAGAIASVAHALDPRGGEAIRAAATALATVSDSTLGLTPPQIALEAIWQGQHLAALGNNEPIKNLLAGAFQLVAGRAQLNVGYFAEHGLPKVFLGGADRLNAEPCWFGATVDVADALVASSAIPGVFPAKHITINGEDRIFIDGGTVSGQPLSVLALEGCGTIYACAAGYDGGRLADPGNLIDNWMQAFTIAIHQATRLEQDYVQTQIGDQGVIHHIHPEVPFPVQGFNFNAAAIVQVLRDASEATKKWITTNHLMPGEAGTAE
jgi:NTE family protein